MTGAPNGPERLGSTDVDAVPGMPDAVTHRLDGIRRDIEFALADIEALLATTRASRDDEQPDT
jgi:hypothetical protein